MRYDCQAQYDRRPYDAVSQAIVLPDVGIATVSTVSAIADVSLSGTLMIGFSVSRDITRKITTAKVPYTKAVTGGIYSGAFFRNVVLSALDHLEVSHVVFVGFFPSEEVTLEPGGNREEFTAYNYAHYLANNPLEDDQLSLLAPTKQDTSTYQRLDYDYVVNNFTVGRLIVGATSKATARIAGTAGMWLSGSGESYLVPASAIVIRDIAGTFVDNETITELSGPGEALVNGTALVPLDFAPAVMYPETYIERLLGGSDWDKVSGIYPYRINPVRPSYVTWVQAPYDNWIWTSDQKQQQPIDDLSEYHNFVWVVKPKLIGTRYVDCAYWVHRDDIDNPDDYALTEHRGLSLPDPVTITKPDSYLVGTVTIDIQGTARKNKVRVIGQGFDGKYIENVQVPDITGTTAGTATQSAGVYYGEERPLAYLEPNPKLTTQALVQERAALLYAYLSLKISTWKATFRQRVDFECYQKLIFSGYPSTEIPDGEYRIISIDIDDNPGAVFVHVTLIRADQFAAQLKMNRVFTNAYLENQRAIKAELAKIPQVYAGTVISIDGNEITGRNEAGQTTITRKLSA